MTAPNASEVGASRRRVRLIAGAALAAGLIWAPTLASHTDRVAMRNGDYLTGEIKKLEYGSLRFKTSATESIDIKWDEIARLTSPEEFQVEVESGERHLGALQDSGSDRQLAVATPGGVVVFDLDHVVRISPIERSFWKRLDGNLSAGFNHTESSGVTQFNLSGSATLRKPKFVRELSFSSVATDQESGKTERDNLTFQTERLLARRYYGLWLATAERNEELGIDLRTQAGGGAGRRLIQTTHTELKLAGGVVGSREQESTESATSETLEAFGVFDHQIFRRTPTQTTLDVTLVAYHTLTDESRLRGEFDAAMNWEIVKDLLWSFSLYSSYTSAPSAGAERSDYGVTTALGWSF